MKNLSDLEMAQNKLNVRAFVVPRRNSKAHMYVKIQEWLLEVKILKLSTKTF